jgi:2-polyprenyl-3-methyl-5-hydroxy-6-metoxy-1,4-benzoquinol methylase
VQRFSDYAYHADVVPHGAAHLIGPLEGICGELNPAVRILEVGCGRGFYSGWFAAHGCTVVGIDTDPTALALARRAYPTCRFEEADLVDGLLGRIGELPFDLVVSTRRIDRLSDPIAFADACFDALRPGGRLVCAAPASGYLRTVARAVAGANGSPLRLALGDATRVWDRRALARLLHDAGFENIQFRGVGRVPLLWASMIVAADRPIETLTFRSESPPLVA